MTPRRYGWIRDLPDHRDRCYTAEPPGFGPLPPSVDLRAGCPPVYDQGQLGSCTANAIAAALEFDRKKQGLPDFTPSRLFIYYNERAMEGTIASDSGAQIRDGIKSVATQGDCPEAEWPYDPAVFAVQPAAQCYADAVKYKAVQYAAVGQDERSVKTCLANGYPFVFGFTVFAAFESEPVAQTGQVPMPGLFAGPPQGGHAVLCVGYDDATSMFTVRNSWGPDWGDKGYFYMRYQYLLSDQYADDFWTISLVQA
jgi:C1A family cysteine protease